MNICLIINILDYFFANIFLSFTSLNLLTISYAIFGPWIAYPSPSFITNTRGVVRLLFGSPTGSRVSNSYKYEWSEVRLTSPYLYVSFGNSLVISSAIWVLISSILNGTWLKTEKTSPISNWDSWKSLKRRPASLVQSRVSLDSFQPDSGQVGAVALTWWYTSDPKGVQIANNWNNWHYSDEFGQELVASFMFVLIYLHHLSEASMLSKENALQLLVIAWTNESSVSWSFYKAGGIKNPAFEFASNFWDQLKMAGAVPLKFIWLYTVVSFFGAAFAYSI